MWFLQQLLLPKPQQEDCGWGGQRGSGPRAATMIPSLNSAKAFVQLLMSGEGSPWAGWARMADMIQVKQENHQEGRRGGSSQVCPCWSTWKHVEERWLTEKAAYKTAPRVRSLNYSMCERETEISETFTQKVGGGYFWVLGLWKFSMFFRLSGFLY